jgi:hypothetical protein
MYISCGLAILACWQVDRVDRRWRELVPKGDIYRDNICPDMHTDAKQLMRTWVNMTQRLCGIACFVICMFCVLLMPIAE